MKLKWMEASLDCFDHLLRTAVVRPGHLLDRSIAAIGRFEPALANLLGNAKVVNIKLFGNVPFPAQLPKEETSRIVKEGLSTSSAAVKEAAEKEFMRIAWQLVDQARAENEVTRLRTYLFSSLIWIGAVTFIYVFGRSVAWVRRGFDDY